MQHTRWVVITGAPCSGKTSTINELEGQGYEVVHETARALINESLAKGLSLSAIKADELSFERNVLAAKIKAESALNPNSRVFLDRAIPDSIAYFKKAGFDITEPLESSSRFRYEKVFLLKRLPFAKDAVRSEDEATAERLELLLFEYYGMLGYHVIPVPIMPPADRTAFVLSHL